MISRTVKIPYLTALLINIMCVFISETQGQIILTSVCRTASFCRIYNLTSWLEVRGFNKQRSATLTVNGEPISQLPQPVGSMEGIPLTFALPLSLDIPNNPSEYSGSSAVCRLLIITTNSQTGLPVTVQCTYRGSGSANPIGLEDRLQANNYTFSSCDDVSGRSTTITGRPALVAGSSITATAVALFVDSGGAVDVNFGKTRVSAVLTELSLPNGCVSRAAESMIMLTNGNLTAGMVQQASWSSGSSTTKVCSTVTSTTSVATATPTTTGGSGGNGGNDNNDNNNGGDNNNNNNNNNGDGTQQQQQILGLSLPALIGIAAGVVLLLASIVGLSCFIYMRFYRIRRNQFYTPTDGDKAEKQLKQTSGKQQNHTATGKPASTQNSIGPLFYGADVGDSFSRIHDSYSTMAASQSLSMEDVFLNGRGGSVGLSGYYLANAASQSHLAEPVQRQALNPEDCTLMTGQAVIALPGFLRMDYHADLRPSRVVAEGGGGIVYEAELMSEHLQFKYRTRQVAVKLAKNPGCWTDEEMLANFRQEVSIMWSLHEHPNIMPVLGYTEEPMALVMPYYSFGMMDILKGSQCQQILTEENVIRYNYQVASAIQTMHQLNIVHRDLKTPNLLIDAPAGGASNPAFWQVIVCDFGLSKPLESGGVEAAVYTNAIGLSYRYAAPELFERMRQMSASRASILVSAQQNANMALEGWEEKSMDCYAFAIIMWEIFEQTTSWPNLANAEIEERVVSRGLRPTFTRNGEPTTDAQRTIKTLIEQCWQQASKDRPSFDQIVDRLQPLLDRQASSAQERSGSVELSSSLSATNLTIQQQEQLQQYALATLRNATGSFYGSYGALNRYRVDGSLGFYQQPITQSTANQQLRRMRSMRQTLPTSFFQQASNAAVVPPSSDNRQTNQKANSGENTNNDNTQ